jgi:cellulose synthase/poly-beta-1,6-N-acetylglucosamine synthase-like glycosyltransferase
MMNLPVVLEALAFTLGLVLVTPCALLLLEVCFASNKGAPSPSQAIVRATPRFVVLIPAHNEEGGIEAVIEPLIRRGYELLVVADNCTDRTCEVARKAGAGVVERLDADRRGKGFALDFGIESLAANPPDVVIVFDADCFLKVGDFETLAAFCHQVQRPIQSFYSMERFVSATTRQQITAFAWTVKNYVRPLGLLRLGVPCQLMGTGMAFPWALISKSKLASSEIVEDMKLGIDFVNAGHGPIFFPAVEVQSSFPTNSLGLQTQRERWEIGHLRMIGGHSIQTILSGILRANIQQLLFGLDLFIPPLAFLAIFVSFFVTLGVLIWLAFGVASLLILALLALAFFSCACLLAWFRFGREDLGTSTLLNVPAYILMKIPLYLRGLVQRPTHWVRTKRDNEGGPE